MILPHLDILEILTQPTEVTFACDFPEFYERTRNESIAGRQNLALNPQKDTSHRQAPDGRLSFLREVTCIRNPRRGTAEILQGLEAASPSLDSASFQKARRSSTASRLGSLVC